MSSLSQIAANRSNAQSSTGPRTPEGKGKSSANATTFGLFTTNNCVFPGEEDEYAQFRDGLWTELTPIGCLEEVHAAEIVRAAWRLRRCAMAEERLGWRAMRSQEETNRIRNTDLPPSDPTIFEQTMKAQAAVDRARSQAQNSLRRAQAALEKLQAARSARKSEPDVAEMQNEAKSPPIAPAPRTEPAHLQTADLQIEPISESCHPAFSASGSANGQNEPSAALRRAA
ncbi:MAG: hypothetical protein KGN84_08870 [Acidobacteriota bacterium]|nr:hypothetical protein [Acidobacteriota bacterium]